MTYKFKAWDELLWFAGVAVGTTVLTALVEFQPDEITDYRTWIISLGAASIRAAAGAVLAALAKSRGEQ